MKEIVSCIFIILLLVSVFGYIEIYNNLSQKEGNEACEKLGFKGYDFIDGFEFCKDFEGNLYYINLECEHNLLWITSCTAKEISVGDVRVLNGN